MAWENQTPQLEDGEDEFALKLKFARIVARDPKAKLNAGYVLFPGEENWGKAFAAQSWLNDPLVQEEVARLRESGEAESLLPTKEALALEIIGRARAADDKDAIGLFKIATEMLGHTSRGTNINLNQDNRVQTVIRVPSRIQTDEQRKDFDERFYLQQTKSIADAKSARPVAN